MKLFFAACNGLLLSLGLLLANNAQAGVFGGPVGLDPSFCKQHNLRQTVVYVDETVLVDGQTSWAVTIYNKLKATLVPGERVTLVELSPTNGQSNELWSGCWPGYTTEEHAKFASQTHFFSRSPLASLNDQQNYFARDLGVAAEKIQQKAERTPSAVNIDPANPPQKSIIRALASDGARYSHSDSTIRAIIYSDLAENSDLGSVFKTKPGSPVDFGDKLGTYLRRSVFYAFGVGNDIQGGGKIIDSIRSFWDNTLRSMAANLGGLGSDLNVPNIVPVVARAYNVTLQENDQNLMGRLSFLADKEGRLVDSWIGITRLRNASINGSFRCTGSDKSPACTLQATTVGGVVTMSPVESINLSSHGTSTLAGQIGVPGSNVLLPLTATPAND